MKLPKRFNRRAYENEVRRIRAKIDAGRDPLTDTEHFTLARNRLCFRIESSSPEAHDCEAGSMLISSAYVLIVCDQGKEFPGEHLKRSVLVELTTAANGFLAGSRIVRNGTQFQVCTVRRMQREIDLAIITNTCRPIHRPET